MKKIILSLVTLITGSTVFSQTIRPMEKIDRSLRTLQTAIAHFQTSLADHDPDSCAQQLLPLATEAASQFIIGHTLNNIAPEQTLRLYEAAARADPNEDRYLQAYATALLRQGNYTAATPLLEKLAARQPDDYRFQVWLADSYIHTGQPKQAVAAWKKADYDSHHQAIDQAICNVYGPSSQYRQRDSLRKAITAGKTAAAYPLIYLDCNWATDWWHTVALDSFLTADLQLIQDKGLPAKDLQILQFYADLKQLPEITYDKLLDMLSINQLIIRDQPLPSNGKLAADLLYASFRQRIADPDEFFAQRGDDLLHLAKKYNDVEFLHIYSHLQTTVQGKVAPEIALQGWKTYHDEHCAISYLTVKKNKKYDDPELALALKEFPDAPLLYFYKASLADIEKKPDAPAWLAKAIQREFRSLGSDAAHTAAKLNEYFSYLGEYTK